MIDDRLDAGRQAVLHAVRHIGAEPRRRQHRRAEAAAARGDAPAVGRRLPPRQPPQPGVHCLADLGFERPLHAPTVARRGRFRRFRPPRDAAASVARRSHAGHSSNSSSHGHRGRLCARAHERDAAPRRDEARRAATTTPNHVVAMRPATAVGHGELRAGDERADPDAADVDEVAGDRGPQRRPRTTDAARRSPQPQHEREGSGRQRGRRRRPGSAPSPGASTMSALEDEAHHAEPEDQQRDERRPSPARARRAGGPDRRRSPRCPPRLHAGELRTRLERALVLALRLDVELGHARAARGHPRAEPDRQLAADDERARSPAAPAAGSRRARRPRSRSASRTAPGTAHRGCGRRTRRRRRGGRR